MFALLLIVFLPIVLIYGISCEIFGITPSLADFLLWTFIGLLFA